MKRQLTEEDISPNQDYFDEIGYPLMRSLYAATLLLLQASLLGSLYVMYSTLSKRPAFFKDGDNSVVHKFPFYMAYFDAKIAVFLTINLIYPTIHVDNWPSIMCSLLPGAYFFSVISDILFIGAFAIIFWLKACYKIEFSLGAYDYKLFVVATIISLVMTIAGGRSFGSDEFWCYAPDQLAIVPKILLIMCFIGLVTSGFCYCNIFARVNKVKKSMLTNKNHDGEMDLADKLFINDSKKMLGYLLTYNAKWVPLTAYVIADLINYEKIHVFFPTMMLFVLFSGILNVTQYINNERKSTNIDSNNNNNDTNQSAVGTM